MSNDPTNKQKESSELNENELNEVSGGAGRVGAPGTPHANSTSRVDKAGPGSLKNDTSGVKAGATEDAHTRPIDPNAARGNTTPRGK